MATAKRVKQDVKYVRVETPSVVQHYTQMVIDGKDQDRLPSGPPITQVFVSSRFVPQPDRIVLDLSVEEAETVRGIMGAIGGSGPRRLHTSGVLAALVSAGIRTSMFDIGVRGQLSFKPSPNEATAASPAKDPYASPSYLKGVPSSDYR